MNLVIRNYFPLFLLLSLLISGCQLLPNQNSYLPPTKLFPANSIEKHHFFLAPNQTIVGTLATLKAQQNDTLPDIARHFGLGYNDITTANPHLDPWLLNDGDKVLLPLHFILPDVKHQGIVLNLANMRLFQFHDSNYVSTYPIGIGREGWNTPKGKTKIISKTKNPVWRVPASILREHAKKGDPLPRVVPAGKNNPLGEYAMRLSIPSYLIHGTNKPYGVGMQISHGCVRLYPENIKTLFKNSKVGTKVNIVDQPYLLGWQHGMLYLEAHKPLQRGKNFKKPLEKRIKKLISQYKIQVDWNKVEIVVKRANGIPTPISVNSPNFYQLNQQALAIQHPEYFYGEPQIQVVTSKDWTVSIHDLKDAQLAQKLAAMLNHQGPPIPARSLQTQVIAGPFKSRKEALEIKKRIQRDFDLQSKINPPNLKNSTQKPSLLPSTQNQSYF